LGREKTVGGILAGLVELAGGAIREQLPNVLLHRCPVVRATEQSVNLGVVEVEHAIVGVTDEQVAAGTGHDDCGALLGRGVDPEFLSLRLICNLLQTVLEIGVLLLGLDPSF
jgi:hypothetical protein